MKFICQPILKLFNFVKCKDCEKWFHKNKDTSCGFSNISGYEEYYFYCKSCSSDKLAQILRGEEIESI